MQEVNTTKLKKEFHKNGFIHISSYFDENEKRELQFNLDRFIEQIVPTMRVEHAFYEDQNNSSSLKQLFHMSDYDDYFGRLLIGSKFESLAESLLGEKIAKGFVEYFNKQAGIGKPTPPHQDCYYFMLTPPQALTFWIPLEDVDEENGCLRYIRGSHKNGMRPHGRTKTLGFSQGITDFGTPEDIANEVSMPAKSGDVLIHHGMTIHRAEGNNSKTRSRRVLGLVYFGESAKEDKRAKEKYQKVLKEESAK